VNFHLENNSLIQDLGVIVKYSGGKTVNQQSNWGEILNTVFENPKAFK